MDHCSRTSPIEALFRKQVRKDPRVRNAYLLVHSDRTGLHINLAEGAGDNGAPAPQQPNYMASVGTVYLRRCLQAARRDYCPLRIPSAATSITD